jgi:hypothetical protein
MQIVKPDKERRNLVGEGNKMRLHVGFEGYKRHVQDKNISNHDK